MLEVPRSYDTLKSYGLNIPLSRIQHDAFSVNRAIFSKDKMQEADRNRAALPKNNTMVGNTSGLMSFLQNQLSIYQNSPVVRVLLDSTDKVNEKDFNDSTQEPEADPYEES